MQCVTRPIVSTVSPLLLCLTVSDLCRRHDVHIVTRPIVSSLFLSCFSHGLQHEPVGLMEKKHTGGEGTPRPAGDRGVGEGGGGWTVGGE